MEEKTMLFMVLGVVAVVAVIGIVSSLQTAETGMGIYIQPGQFQRGLAIRQLGSGIQSSVSNIGQGVYNTAGESQSPSAQSKHITARIPGAYNSCMPRDDSGNFMYDAGGNIIVGWEVSAYSASSSNILNCVANYFKDIGTPLPENLCCWNSYTSSLPGSTGAAYRSY